MTDTKERRSNSRVIVTFEEENQRNGTEQILKNILQETFAYLKKSFRHQDRKNT